MTVDAPASLPSLVAILTNVQSLIFLYRATITPVHAFFAIVVPIQKKPILSHFFLLQSLYILCSTTRTDDVDLHKNVFAAQTAHLF